jgi:protein TonB
MSFVSGFASSNALGFRTILLFASIALHGMAVAAFIPIIDDQNAPIDALELSLMPPEGETALEEKDLIDSSAQIETAQAQDSQIAPVVRDEQEAELAKVIEPDAEVISVSSPLNPPNEPSREPDPQIQDKENPVEAREKADSKASSAADESFASRAVGVQNGLRSGGGASRAAYAAALKKEITRRKRRPDADAHGAVTIAFVIGPAGAPTSITIEGEPHPVLADAARWIIASVQMPPPPGGSFSGTVSIKFE